MFSFMLHKSIRRCEVFTAYITGIFPESIMSRVFESMILQTGLDGERRITLLTAVRPLASVSALVDHQGVDLREGFATLGAGIRFVCIDWNHFLNLGGRENMVINLISV